MHPTARLRSSPIAGVVLTGGDVDAIAGLLTLRERQPFTVLATQRVHDVLERQSDFRGAGAATSSTGAWSRWRGFALDLPDGSPSGLTSELFAVPGKTPLIPGRCRIRRRPAHRGRRARPSAPCSRDGTTRLFFIPGCAAMTPRLAERLRGADLVLFDGTLWQDDEMIRAGLGTKTGRRMGHMSVTGAGRHDRGVAGCRMRRERS